MATIAESYSHQMFSEFMREMYRTPFRSLSSPPDFPFSAEDTLLLNCAGTEVSSEKIEGSLDPNLDWEYIVTSAINHRIAPLLYYNLNRLDNGLVPSEVIIKLQETYVDTLGRNFLASNQLSVVLRSLSDAQVRAIVLKGMALAETVYPNTALRPFTDIDLLIHEEDLHRVGEKLSQLGYVAFPDHHPGFARQFGVALFYLKRNVLGIDVHWHIARLPYSRYIPIDQLWESAISVNIKGTDTLVLSPEDLLIHLCLHVSKESYSLLIWLADISEVIYHYSETLDWGLLLEKIQLYKTNSLMCYVLSLVRSLFSAPVPSPVLEHLSSSEAVSFEARLFRVLADPGIADIKWGVAEFLTIRGIMAKVKFLIGILLPGRDYIAKKYPDKNTYSSYLSRIAYVLREALYVGYRVVPRILKASLR